MTSRKPEKPQVTKLQRHPVSGKTKPRSGKTKPRSYHGEALTAEEIRAIEAHVSLSESSLGPDCYPSTLSHRSDPRLPYRRKVYKLRTACHQGQTKLALALLRLLTNHGHLAKVVVYAGAAPGTNISFIASLFPEHVFYLYDPAPFKLAADRATDARGRPVAPRIHAVQGPFTDETAHEWHARGEEIIFISDIRKPTAKDEDFEDEVAANMATQLRWYEIIGEYAAVSQFKFRLPYEGGSIEYLAGEIQLQPKASLSSTETRLVVLGPDAPRITYDAKVYEEELFYHNTVRREWGFYPIPECESGLLDVVGYDGCYDCRVMAEAYADYLLRHIDYYLPPPEQESAETPPEARPAVEARPAFEAPPQPGREVLYPHVAFLVDRQMRHLRQFLKSPPHGVNPGGPMRDRRAGLFAHLGSSREKQQQRLRVHEKGRRRARRAEKQKDKGGGSGGSGNE